MFSHFHLSTYFFVNDIDSNASKPEDIVLSSPIFSDKKEKDENIENIGMKNSIQPPQPPDPLEELRWGENMVLVGDTFWRSFMRFVPRIKTFFNCL